jgi:hypothetical protein
MLPHVGLATPTITKFASFAANNKFYKQIINPKDWVKSNTFGGYIFVGPYTVGVSRQRIRDAKIAAVNSMELFTLDANYKQTWPTTVLNGFNYDAFGQGPWSQPLVTSFYKSAVALGHGGMTADVPTEGTIIESPVGSITAAQMQTPKNQPQAARPGICVPHEFEIKDNGGGYAVKSGAELGVSTTDEYFASYGNTNFVFVKSMSHVNGVVSTPVANCTSFS